MAMASHQTSTTGKTQIDANSVVCIPCVGDHTETHQKQEEKLVQRGQWVRAAILGANDGLLSTTSLMLGVGAAKEADRESMVLSGLAGAIAGACSMAVGEFVSVSTQKEIEQVARRRREASNLAIEDANQNERQQTLTNSTDPKHQHMLAMFSPARSPALKVLAEIKRSEGHHLGEREADDALPSPIKAAAASWLAFICGSFVPLATTMLAGGPHLTKIVTLTLVTSVALAVFGGLGAHLGGSGVRVAATRVLLGGWLAMGITYGALKPFDRDHDNGKVEN